MTVDEVLALPNDDFDRNANWFELDHVIGSLNNSHAQMDEWNRLLKHTESIGSPTGHPHWRLGILHLLLDATEDAGIAHLEAAYESDKRYAPERAHKMAAYRVLSLIKDFLAELRSRGDWQSRQLEPQYRRVLMDMLLAIYDQTARRQILDMPIHTYAPFFRLITDDRLRAFAGENYMCAQSLLEWVETQNGHSFIQTNQYAFARSIVGLYGGVLEALLTDRLSAKGRNTLGTLINDAYNKGLLALGTNLCALCTIILYFRNHVHAGRTAMRKTYFVDLYVAKDLKIATDTVISELLRAAGVNFAPTP